MALRILGIILGWMFLFPEMGSAQQPISTSSFLHLALDSGIEGRQLIALSTVEVAKQPVACFGLTKIPGQPPRYAYLLVFNQLNDKEKSGLATECKGRSSMTEDDFNLDFDGVVKVGKKKVEVGYTFKYDPVKKALQGEVLRLGGKEVSTEGSRVFLVDLRGENLTYTPIKAEKLDLLPRQSTEGGYERGVLNTIEGFKKDSPEVKKFLD
jgi:hypothetical protein